MKRIIIASLILAMIVGLGIAFAGTKGNGAPPGPHYNLNIIGKEKPKGKAPPVDTSDGSNNGHRIFVPLNDKCQILLQEGPFDVIDYDGTDGKARFQLPMPDEDETPDDQVTYSDYSVFIRLRGKPNGRVIITTCLYDKDTGGILVPSDQVVDMTRLTGKGNNKFVNVSQQLLYVYAWIWNETKKVWEYQRIPLFDDDAYGYLWDYDNRGCKIAQLRFYLGVTTPIDPAVPPGPPPS